MVVRYYSSVAPETTLSATINNSATVIQVASTTGFPALTPYTLALDYEGATEELVQVNVAAGTNLTVTRAIDGTSAAAHNAGARVRHVSSARDFADSRNHENSDEGVHGLGPTEEIVGTDRVQTLTNKTLASPTVTGTIAGDPGFSGTWTGGAAAKLRLTNATDASPTSTNHALQVGPDTNNIRMDGNEIMSVVSGAPATLYVQSDGGNLVSYNNRPADSLTDSYIINGVVAANQHQGFVASGAATTFSSRITGDANSRWLVRANGQQSWGPGTATQDVSLTRTGAGTLNINGSLTLDSDLNVGNVTTLNTLNVTSLNVNSTNIASGSLATASSGWSVAASTAGVLRAGFVTANLNFTRTGAAITVNANGTLSTGPIQMGTVNGTYAPATFLGLIHMHAGNSLGFGDAQISGGAVTLNKWLVNQNINTGDTVSITVTYAIN